MNKSSFAYMLCMLVSISIFAQSPKEQKTQAQPVKAEIILNKPATDNTGALNLGTLPAANYSIESLSPSLQAGYEAESEMPATTVLWSESEVDFGEIKQGEVARHLYKVKNTGTNPLKITNVKPSCGCTVPNWPKDEIKAGETAEIEVKFDSTGKLGIQHKTVTVFLNTEARRQILRFNGVIVQ